MSNKIWYPKEKRRLAWRVFKYFILNQNVLNEEQNMNLFEKAKEILINIYALEHGDADVRGIEKALIMVAKWENRFRLDNFTIDEKTVNMLLKSE